MKKLTLLLLLALPVSAPADDSCAKNSDACSGGKKQFSPFAAASLSEMERAQDARRPELKPGPVKKEPELEPAPEKKAGAPQASAVPQAASAAAARELSSPLWLFFVGGSLAGLYFYLRGGSRKGRRK